jgi:hypothetical protein
VFEKKNCPEIFYKSILNFDDRRFGKANWWIGLRLTEDCKCMGSTNTNNDPTGRSLEATKSTFEVKTIQLIRVARFLSVKHTKKN